ncbi:carbohydrate-binding protein [Aquimarina agarilytica]|uniref:carbohydrate-binding protein n=1 Tax=Aquimarina agarilytica TaxID=1087449 RepID=UPI000288FE94|nr:carbohydrate-binding protein [Aquimarina agarilytica]
MKNLKLHLLQKITLICLLLNTLNFTYGQGCAVQVTQKDFDNTMAINASMALEKLNQKTASNTNALARKKITIPYVAQIVTRTDGTGGITIEKINEGIRYANQFYQDLNLDIELKEYQSPRYINSDIFFEFLQSDEASITSKNEIDKVLNIYFVNNITNSNGGTYCGYAYFPDPQDLENDLDRIFMDNDCMGGFPETTFIHEIGHYLNLFHTHETFFGNEYVNGSNCSSTGDLICDTPADPQLSYSVVDFDCNYTDAQMDINGDTYTPNTNNVMSYSRHSCRTELSPMQIEKARFTAENYRADLKQFTSIAQSPYNGVAQTVPGTIEMEFYDLGGQDVAYNDTDKGNNGNSLRTDDVDIVGGNIAWIQKDEWLEYTIDIKQAGNYAIEAHIASIFTNSRFSLSIDGVKIGQDFNVSNTGNWETYEIVSQIAIPLGAGIKTFRFTSITGGFNIDKINFDLPATTQTPYNGVAQTIPGSIEAEFYDLGGQNIAYNDTGKGNNGNYLRTDDVDIQKGAVNGNVGWISASEWLEYTVDIKQTGSYTITANVASITANNTFSLAVEGTTIGELFSVPNTGNWQKYKETSQSNITLTAGTKVLRFETNTGKFNLDKINFTLTPTTPTQSPYNGIAQTVPGSIEMEFYDLGGQDVAYNDKDTGNNGNYLRTDDVDIYNGIVAWIQKDEWLEYTITVEQTGSYTINALVSSIFADRSFELSIDGTTIGQQFSVPNTENWENFQTSTQNNIYLTAGQKVLRLTSLTGGFNINKIDINAESSSSQLTLVSDHNLIQPKITVYPNPVITDAVIKAPHNITKIILFDTSGNFIGSFNGNNTPLLTLNLSALKKGTYIATIQTDLEIFTSSIVKE